MFKLNLTDRATFAQSKPVDQARYVPQADQSRTERDTQAQSAAERLRAVLGK